jgi:hypothetical protein
MKRFWDKVKIAGPNDCWEWQACKNKHGYGEFFFNGRRHGAHRVAYQLTYGDFDQNLVCCHKCDNTSCVNPKHLFLGTQQDNVDDMMKKGRKKLATHCIHGHEYTEANTMRYSNRRTCKTCHNRRSRISMRKYYARRKEQECQK